MIVIQLDHPSDPRFLIVREPPDRVTLEDLADWRYGKPLLFAPEEPVAIYEPLSEDSGTVWVKPET